jgi:hypothetical protein
MFGLFYFNILNEWYIESEKGDARDMKKGCEQKHKA